jgi:AraC-like DNA-binding protein
MDKAPAHGDDSSVPKVIPDAPAAIEWTTTSIASRHLVALLDDAGQPPDALLAQAGVRREDLASPDLPLPLATFRELWQRAARLRPDIGLTLVESFPPGQMHMLAHLAMRSATVDAALAAVCRHAGITSAADRVALDAAGPTAWFSYAVATTAPDNPWMAEHYLTMLTVFLAQACGRTLPIIAVEFAGPRQAPEPAYVQRFGVMPRFGTGVNRLAFDPDVLSWPLLTHDAYLHAILARVAQSRTPAPHDALLVQVRREIDTALVQGRVPTLVAVAAACGLGVKALRARLAHYDASFRQLLDEGRRELVRDHLARGLSITETACLLGFSEPAALQHACRRWFGQSAGELQGRRPDVRAGAS